jgi:2,4-dienoyl-CoA reductase-like NADH-dependent reductase (Old Yellow Enzyme family)/thioredoxin reductase
MSGSNFKYLFSPLRIKNILIKNRIVMPAMNTNFADRQGYVTQKIINYYKERAKGGVGLIIISSAYVDINAKKRCGGLAIYDDAFIPRLALLARSLKECGAAVFQQLNHNGRLLASSDLLKTNVEEKHVVAPSPIPHPLTGTYPRELTLQDIKELIDKFAQAAWRAKTAGFDGVEIHGAHGYLVGQFFSPYTNKRSDVYGGNLERRMKFPLDLVREVKRATGGDFAIGYRMSATEFVEGGVSVEDAKILARELEKTGVDLIHVTGGINETPESMLSTIPPMTMPQDILYPLAAHIKEVVSVPVIAVGRINSPEMAEEILQSGGADLVATGRALICDPMWPQKAMHGRVHEIRKCVACNQGCIEKITQEQEQTCLLNPEVGREGLGDLIPSERKKKVVIIGGGLGGLEAAIISSLKGHDVELFEEEPEMGGQCLLAAKPPRKEIFYSALYYLTNEINRLGVSLHLNEKATVEKVQRCYPDTIIVATGGFPLFPKIPGIDNSNVVSAWDVLKKEEAKGKILVVGAGLVGVEVALFLSEKGINVTLIEKLDKIAYDAGPLMQARYRSELDKTDINVKCQTELVKIDDEGAFVLDETGEYKLKADTIVLALGIQSDNSFYKQLLKYKCAEVHAIGDCLKPRRMIDAIHEAYKVSIM